MIILSKNFKARIHEFHIHRPSQSSARVGICHEIKFQMNKFVDAHSTIFPLNLKPLLRYGPTGNEGCTFCHDKSGRYHSPDTLLPLFSMLLGMMVLNSLKNNLNSSPREKWTPFRKRHFKRISRMTILYFDSNFTEVCN